MAVNIAVLGLRQIGLSAAKALKDVDDRIACHGWDPDRDTWSEAERQGCIKTIHKHIDGAVKDAKVVILSLPADVLKAKSDEINDALADGSVMLNFSMVHQAAAGWFADGKKENVHYLSLFAALSPLVTIVDDVNAGRISKDLFRNSVIYILDPLHAEQVALDLAVDVCVLLGGKPVFADTMEADGLISANLLLQRVVAASVMETAAGQPSWREGKLIAGKDLASSTLPMETAAMDGDLAASIVFQKDLLVPLMNNLIKEMVNYRDVLSSDDDDAITVKFEDALTKREDWIAARSKTFSASQLATSIPDAKQALKRFMRLDA